VLATFRGGAIDELNMVSSEVQSALDDFSCLLRSNASTSSFSKVRLNILYVGVRVLIMRS
jgi:hypothetical protein